MDLNTFSRNVALLSKKVLKREKYTLHASVGSLCSNIFQEGIAYAHFRALFSSLLGAHRQLIIGLVKDPQLFVEYEYPNNVIGKYWFDGRAPVFQQRRLYPVLQFQNQTRDRSLCFFQSDSQPVENPHQEPLRCRVLLEHVFLLSNRFRYELIKTSQGKTLEDATQHDPVFLVRLYLQRAGFADVESYARSFYTKAGDLLGLGAYPSLIRSSFKKKEKKRAREESGALVSSSRAPASCSFLS